MGADAKIGAGTRVRTEDLLITNQMLYQLSYTGFCAYGPKNIVTKTMERETGIEPATNSLEGCDSTVELLPHFLCSV